MTLQEPKIYYRRNLPHYQPENSIYFITFRIADSLSLNIIQQLRKDKKRKNYFAKFDKLLDGSKTGPVWLKNEKIADLISKAIKFRDGKEYDLLAYSIMPNHVHMVFAVTRIADSSSRNSVSTYIVTKILQELKKYTALRANKILQRSGQFWHHESYDHVVKDDKELSNIIEYVLHNLVKAGFV